MLSLLESASSDDGWCLLPAPHAACRSPTASSSLFNVCNCAIVVRAQGPRVKLGHNRLLVPARVAVALKLRAVTLPFKTGLENSRYFGNGGYSFL